MFYLVLLFYGVLGDFVLFFELVREGLGRLKLKATVVLLCEDLLFPVLILLSYQVPTKNWSFLPKPY